MAKKKPFDDHGGLYVDLRNAKPCKVPCDGCGVDISKDPRSWVGFWVEYWRNAAGAMRRRPRVHFFGVHCRPCAAKLCDVRTGEAGEEIHRHDVNLDAWAGGWSIIQVRQVLKDYAWRRKDLRRMLNFAVRASSLPTGQGALQI